MAIEAVSYGVADLKVAPWLAGSTYGTAVDVWGVSQFGLTIETASGRLEGDDVILRAHARPIACQITARFAFQTLEPYETMTGKTIQDGTSLEWLEIANDSFPYFGMIAQVLNDDEEGDVHIFVPKCKLMSGFQMQMQYGQFVTPEITIDGVKDDTYGIVRIIPHENTTAIAFPPSFA